MSAFVFCFDCGKRTASTLAVYRDPYGTGARTATLVCRNGTGCNKGRSAFDARSGPADDPTLCARCGYRGVGIGMNCPDCGFDPDGGGAS